MNDGVHPTILSIHQHARTHRDLFWLLCASFSIVDCNEWQASPMSRYKISAGIGHIRWERGKIK